MRTTCTHLDTHRSTHKHTVTHAHRLRQSQALAHIHANACTHTQSHAHHRQPRNPITPTHTHTHTQTHTHQRQTHTGLSTMSPGHTEACVTGASRMCHVYGHLLLQCVFCVCKCRGRVKVNVCQSAASP